MSILIPPLRIAEWRERRRLSQEGLGLIAANHPDPARASEEEKAAARLEISRYENGESVPSWERLVAIAQSMGLEDVRDLIAPMPVKKWRRKLATVEMENAHEQVATTLRT